MAERRMFAKTIIDSDAFVEMPQSSQLLYFHLSMRADDDGFINKPKSIMRVAGCKEDDLKILCMKKFIIPFESGVVVIKHWRIHNYIRKDTYNETSYKEEKSMLELDENNSYRLICNEAVDGSLTQDRLGKDRLGKDRLGKDSIGKDSIKNKEYALSQLEVPKSFIAIMTNSGEEFPITEDLVNEFKELYPNVNIEQELRNMKGWSIANPRNRKTKTGMMKFINSWLSKQQNRSNGYKNTYSSQQVVEEPKKESLSDEELLKKYG